MTCRKASRDAGFAAPMDNGPMIATLGCAAGAAPGCRSVPGLGDTAPSTGPLVDSYGRVATDLRVSLTDRCNLRCTYCMPAEGLPWSAAEQLLQPDEIVRLVRIGVTRLGITKVRFTGGEPLLAKHLDEIVAATAALRPRPELALTTNGVLLAKRAEALARAGLDRVNVSLDSVDYLRFAAITRRDRLADVLAGLAAAHAAGLRPVKVNAVLDPQTGLDDAVALVRFCLGHDYQLADHRADAARCRTPVAPRGYGDRGPGAGAAAASFVHAGTRSGAAGFGAGRVVADHRSGDWTHREGRGHRLGVASLLLDL